MAEKIVRISLSLEDCLLKKLSGLVKKHGYENRSEFVRDMIRDRLTEESWNSGDEALGTVTLLYNHHKRGVTEKLVELQHHRSGVRVLASTHIHLSHEICVEMIMLRGKPDCIHSMADSMRKLCGVLHAGLSIVAAGKEID